MTGSPPLMALQQQVMRSVGTMRSLAFLTDERSNTQHGRFADQLRKEAAMLRERAQQLEEAMEAAMSEPIL